MLKNMFDENAEHDSRYRVFGILEELLQEYEFVRQPEISFYDFNSCDKFLVNHIEYFAEQKTSDSFRYKYFKEKYDELLKYEPIEVVGMDE